MMAWRCYLPMRPSSGPAAAWRPRCNGWPSPPLLMPNLATSRLLVVRWRSRQSPVLHVPPAGLRAEWPDEREGLGRGNRHLQDNSADQLGLLCILFATGNTRFIRNSRSIVSSATLPRAVIAHKSPTSPLQPGSEDFREHGRTVDDHGASRRWITYSASMTRMAAVKRLASTPASPQTLQVSPQAHTKINQMDHRGGGRAGSRG